MVRTSGGNLYIWLGHPRYQACCATHLYCTSQLCVHRLDAGKWSVGRASAWVKFSFQLALGPLGHWLTTWDDLRWAESLSRGSLRCPSWIHLTLVFSDWPKESKMTKMTKWIQMAGSSGAGKRRSWTSKPVQRLLGPNLLIWRETDSCDVYCNVLVAYRLNMAELLVPSSIWCNVWLSTTCPEWTLVGDIQAVAKLSSAAPEFDSEEIL